MPIPLIAGDQYKFNVIQTPNDFVSKLIKDASVTKTTGKANEIKGLTADKIITFVICAAVPKFKRLNKP